MFKLQHLLQTTIAPRNVDQTRKLWHYLNIIFNRMDTERRKKFGPDRTCAEWILRNGGTVKFTGSNEYLGDYNLLPPEETKLFLKSVNATDASIMHYGFDHFHGCKHLDKIILHKCQYIYDKALEELIPLNGTLKHLQVSECHNVSDIGLMHLGNLNSLQTLIIANLSGVKDLNGVVDKLQTKLLLCTINP